MLESSRQRLGAMVAKQSGATAFDHRTRFHDFGTVSSAPKAVASHAQQDLADAHLHAPFHRMVPDQNSRASRVGIGSGHGQSKISPKSRPLSVNLRKVPPSSLPLPPMLQRRNQPLSVRS